MDFYGNPYREAGGWSTENAIGQLWKRFSAFYEEKKNLVKNLESESGYELWIDLEDKEHPKADYILVGVAVKKIRLPLELVAKVLPATKYAVFNLKGGEIKSDWPSKAATQWLTEAGLKRSFPYIIEYYDSKRFRALQARTPSWISMYPCSEAPGPN